MRIPTLKVGYKTIELGLLQPAKVHYANGIVSLDRTEIKGAGTDLTLQGAVPLKSAQPLNVAANGSIDLGLLQTMGTGFTSSGRVLVNISARGGVSRPTMTGQIQIGCYVLERQDTVRIREP